MPPIGVFTYVLLAVPALIAGTALAANFNPGCVLPFKPIQVKHAIDIGATGCGLERTKEGPR